MMTNTEQTIPCPVCKTNIHFDVQSLLKGIKFSCTNCGSSIGLAEESKPLVQLANDKFEILKETVQQQGK